MTLPMLCTAAATFVAMNAGRAAPDHARQTMRTAARQARIQPHRPGSPVRALNTEG